MAIGIEVGLSQREIDALSPKGVKSALTRAMRKAGATALRDMKSEASKRIRARKRIKVGLIGKSFRLRRPRGARVLDAGEWALDVKGAKTPLSAYPHRQTKKGVSVEINRGRRVLVKHAFIATMTRGGKGGGGAGHKGIFRRKGTERLPIMELIGSRPIDALLHKGEAEGVQQRGARSMTDTVRRLLPLELAKGRP